ncbi:MAG TPA: hypothetical protein VK633_14600 [Verrucomicrobiae bacterium]|nr:hypothetical protein [Verrucomicrobiae bacterium]
MVISKRVERIADLDANIAEEMVYLGEAKEITPLKVAFKTKGQSHGG